MWEAHLIDLVSGRVGARLDLAADPGSWRETLGEIPEWTLKVGKESLASVPDVDLLPWANGTVVLHDGQPVLAGPIVRPWTEDRTTLTLACKGIEATIAGWRVLPQEFYTGGSLRESGPLAFAGLSLGEIQWQIVATQMTRLGVLPIVHGMPTSTGIHQRTYDTWNLSNNVAFQRIQEVAEVIGGPDFAFWPRWADPGNQVEWVMVHGIGDDQALPQAHQVIIDTTAAGGPVATLTPLADWDPATCVYGIGAGQEAGTLISVQRPTFPAHLRIPAREDVLSDTGTDDWDLVQAHTRAEGDSRIHPTVQMSVELATDHPTAGLGVWRCGNAARVSLDTSMWRLARNLPEQAWWRAIARHGSIGGTTYTVELQEA